MKNFIFLILISSIVLPVYGQKVNYKKGKIIVNKKTEFLVEKRKDKINRKTRFYLKRPSGEEILELIDTTFYLHQLPNEGNPRPFVWALVINAPKINKTSMVPIFYPMNPRKRLAEDLEKIGFFKNKILTEDIYNSYIALHNKKQNELNQNMSKIDVLNTNRQKNYEATEKMFGKLFERGAYQQIVATSEGNIIEKQSTFTAHIGQFRIAPDGRGIYAHTYNIINKAEQIIGRFIFTPQEKAYKAKLIMEIDNQFKEHEKFDCSDCTTKEIALKYLFNEAATYLVLNGYL